jgi:trigger factor
MNISIETMSGLERRLTISVASETFEAQITNRLSEAAGKIRLPGFRAGKVPMREVRRRFGNSVRAEVAGELMQSTFVTAVRQEALTPAGQPQLEVVRMDPGLDFEFTATFEVFPTVELANLTRAALRQPTGEITSADVDEMVDRLREQRKTWTTVERAAQDGDRVTVDFKGTRDGEPFAGGSGEGNQFVLGAGQMIADFDRGVAGLTPGAETRFEATFPEDYRATELAGKTVTFEVTLKQVEEPSLPALDDAFFANFGVNEGGLDAFRADVQRNMQRELDEAVRTQVKNQVMEQLHALHTVQLPQVMVAREADQLRQQMMQQFRMYGANGQPDLPQELFREQAERRVAVGLIVNEIVRSAGLKVDSAAVRARVESLAEGYAEPRQVIDWYYNNAEQLEQIELSVLEELVVNHVVSQAQVENVPSNYRDIVSGKALTPPAADADKDEVEA